MSLLAYFILFICEIFRVYVLVYGINEWMKCSANFWTLSIVSAHFWHAELAGVLAADRRQLKALGIDYIWIRADDAYFVGEMYTLEERCVWFFAGKGFLSIDNAIGLRRAYEECAKCALFHSLAMIVVYDIKIRLMSTFNSKHQA